ncbi:MAG: UDP-N-acetylmuramoyl-L-alanyl-D-glutamate--2,6-diaminopimelate ligase [Hydrogenophilus sp.]|nr:UDP-N-acetylmuramoyl-L-alanyl-D-glutamate--2,6-diaminopimelate ligase [Hydrogenophilus sp.]
MRARERRLVRELREVVGSAPLVDDSRQVTPGAVFVAWRSRSVDRLAFVADAVQRGAGGVVAEGRSAAAVAERAGVRFTPEEKARRGWIDLAEGRRIPLWTVPESRGWVGRLADEWYGRPSERVRVWGVTGTNGKTTVSQWLAQCWAELGVACGVMGTLGVGRWGALREIGYTTPPAVAVHEWLRRWADEGVEYASVEVSSIGAEEGRVEGVRFAGVMVTNVTRDHLDYHGSLAAYRAAKRSFLFQRGVGHRVFWLGDAVGRRWGERAATREDEAMVWWVGEEGVVRQAEEAVQRVGGVKGEVRVLVAASHAWREGRWRVEVWEGRWEEESDRIVPVGESVPLEIPAAGTFQVANGLLVVAALRGEGVPLRETAEVIARVQPPVGRMMAVGEQPAVFVDYAHTPDAIAAVVQSLRPMATARGGALWVVVGAGGNRDAGKRALMGRAAALADRVVVTSDNPRDEDPESIARAVAAGIPKGRWFRVVLDREEAIEQAVAEAKAEDVVVILGKGHESFQEVRGERRPFSDIASARAALRRRGGSSGGTSGGVDVD